MRRLTIPKVRASRKYESAHAAFRRFIVDAHLGRVALGQRERIVLRAVFAVDLSSVVGEADVEAVMQLVIDASVSANARRNLFWVRRGGLSRSTRGAP